MRNVKGATCDHSLSLSAQMMKSWTGDGGEAGALSLMLDLGPYVNTSSPTVHSSFSVERAHMLFRSLGLRHLTIVDAHNRVKGILTRKVTDWRLSCPDNLPTASLMIDCNVSCPDEHSDRIYLIDCLLSCLKDLLTAWCVAVRDGAPQIVSFIREQDMRWQRACKHH